VDLGNSSATLDVFILYSVVRREGKTLF
jgi:hypothetical protein